MAHELAPGDVVSDRFVLQQEIGSGGSGVVWRANDIADLDRSVALKVIAPEYRADPRFLDRFRREIGTLTKLNHPNIVRPLAYNLDGRHAFLAMEWLSGHTLGTWIRNHAEAGEHLPLTKIETILQEVCAPIAHAHAHGIIHRDIKPGNTIIQRVDDTIRVRLLDFGIAKIVGAGPSGETTVGRVFGTPSFMAPEQFGAEAIDDRTDVFALGCVLFELLTLRRAWVRNVDDQPALAVGNYDSRWNSPLHVMRRITSAERPLASTLRPVSGAVDDLLASAMAIRPEDRPPSALALYEGFVAACASCDTTTSLSFGEPTARDDTMLLTTPVSDPPSQDLSVADTTPEGWVADQAVGDSTPARGGLSIPLVLSLMAMSAMLTAGLFTLSRPTAVSERPSPRATPRRPAPAKFPTVVPAAAKLSATPEAVPARKNADRPPPRSRPTPPRARSRVKATPDAPKKTSQGRLESMLAKARSRPDETRLVGELAAAILEQAQALPNGPKRDRIVALVDESAIVGDTKGLARALTALRRAQR